MNEQKFIDYVRNYALEHYDTGGWDYVEEAWSDEDILKCYSNANGDTKKAFKEIAKIVKSLFEFSEEIRSTAF